MEEIKQLDIYTDGACSGNPGPGGFGVLFLIENQKTLVYSEYAAQTTSNRMELSAFLWALQHIDHPNHRVNLYSDSEYVVKGVNQWLSNWKSNGWRTTGGPVKNLEIWMAIDKYLKEVKLKVESLNILWIRGHNNNYYNDEVDRMAKNIIIENKS